MSISKALRAEKPAAKRPRSYMEGPCGRKLSIMSIVLPNTPSQKSKEQILSFFGGYVRQNRARTMSIRRALASKRPISYMEGPRGGKTNCRKSKQTYMEGCFPWLHPPRTGGARARAPPLFFRGGALCACGILSIYLSIYIYLPIPLYIKKNIYIYIYIYISLSLSLFEQVKLLERAQAGARVRYEAENMR